MGNNHIKKRLSRCPPIPSTSSTPSIKSTQCNLIIPAIRFSLFTLYTKQNTLHIKAIRAKSPTPRRSMMGGSRQQMVGRRCNPAYQTTAYPTNTTNATILPGVNLPIPPPTILLLPSLFAASAINVKFPASCKRSLLTPFELSASI